MCNLSIRGENIIKRNGLNNLINMNLQQLLKVKGIDKATVKYIVLNSNNINLMKEYILYLSK